MSQFESGDAGSTPSEDVQEQQRKDPQHDERDPGGHDGTPAGESAEDSDSTLLPDTGSEEDRVS
jgi:hypothetical protein